MQYTKIEVSTGSIKGKFGQPVAGVHGRAHNNPTRPVQCCQCRLASQRASQRASGRAQLCTRSRSVRARAPRRPGTLHWLLLGAARRCAAQVRAEAHSVGKLTGLPAAARCVQRRRAQRIAQAGKRRARARLFSGSRADLRSAATECNALLRALGQRRASFHRRFTLCTMFMFSNRRRRQAS